MLREIAARARSLWRGVRHRDRLSAEMDAEFHAHIQSRSPRSRRAPSWLRGNHARRLPPRVRGAHPPRAAHSTDGSTSR